MITSTLSSLFLGQLKNLGKATSECETWFRAGSKEACIEEKEEELSLSREDTANAAEVFRKDETKKIVNVIEVRIHHLDETWNDTDELAIMQSNLKRQISELVDVALNKASAPDMWDNVLAAFK